VEVRDIIKAAAGLGIARFRWLGLDILSWPILSCLFSLVQSYPSYRGPSWMATLSWDKQASSSAAATLLLIHSEPAPRW